MDIREASLGTLLQQPEVLVMAPYQRRYEWQLAEFEQLMEDLFGALAENGQGEPPAPYFMGSVILYRNAPDWLEVVDGQQRLTSMTLILLAARELTENSHVRDQIGQFIVKPADPIAGTEARFRLTLHRGDQEFYAQRIYPLGSSQALHNAPLPEKDSHACLQRNFMRAYAHLRDMGEETFRAFLQFLLNDSRFIRVEVPRAGDPFRVFETVNSRGRPLRSEDVVRFALIEFASESEEDRADLLNMWDTVEADLGERGMDNFLKTWRKEILQGRQSNRSMTTDILSSFTDRSEARQFLSTRLSGNVGIFREISAADSDFPPGPEKDAVDRALLSLQLVDHEVEEWRHIAQILLRRFRNDPTNVAHAMVALERLSWYYYLINDRKGVRADRRRHFSALANKVTNETPDAFLRALMLTPERKETMRNAILGQHDPKAKYLRSLMVKLEIALHPNVTRVHRNDVTVEHILPVKPRSNSYWQKQFTADARILREYVQKLGNLALVPPDLNSALGNKVYQTKRRLVCQAGVHNHFRTAAVFAQQAEWNREIVDERTKLFQRALCEDFNLQPIQANGGPASGAAH
ncbi:MAG: DUF262 domain-containing HNH endonuclease family protein [Pseudomonadota bacterium]